MLAVDFCSSKIYEHTNRIVQTPTSNAATEAAANRVTFSLAS